MMSPCYRYVRNCILCSPRGISIDSRAGINKYFSSRLITNYFSLVDSTERLIFLWDFSLLTLFCSLKRKERENTKQMVNYAILYYFILLYFVSFYITQYLKRWLCIHKILTYKHNIKLIVI